RAVGAAEDLIDTGVIDNADAQDFGRGAELGGGRRGRSHGAGEGFERDRTTGPQRRRESGVDDSTSYRRALAAQADEPHPRHDSCSLIIRWIYASGSAARSRS